MLEGFLIGLQTALSVQNLLMVIGGCLIGTFIGMLPGLGPMSIIAIMIPVAISMGDPSAALILLAGVYYGAIFGGSTSSILLNAPGVAGTVASSFDGYPMARQGKAGKALTVAAIASFAGGTIGALLLMIFAPALSSVALLFHSAEYFALMVVGLSAIAAFAGTGQVAKALVMTLLGLIMATVGEGALFNLPRFTMGIMDLQSGFGFITLAMAMFALPEALFLVLKPKDLQGDDGKIKELRITGKEAKAIAPVIGRQSLQASMFRCNPGFSPFSAVCGEPDPGFPHSCPHPDTAQANRYGPVATARPALPIRSRPCGLPRNAVRTGVRRRPPSGPPTRAGRGEGRSRSRSASA